MVRRIGIALLALLALAVLIGVALPKRFEVERTRTIPADRARIFALIGDLRAWPRWEPFSGEDPTTQVTLGPTTTGVGASQSWAGHGNTGRLVFTRCEPDSGIEYDLVFTNGERESPAQGWMRMTPRDGGATEVAWGMRGEMSFPLVGGYLALFADSFTGAMFADGLANLERAALRPEAPPEPAASPAAPTRPAPTGG